MSTRLEALERALAYRFTQPALLEQALTHRSHSQPHYERLEFLGDSVLNFVAALALYERFGELKEGELSRLRAQLVRQESLYRIAEQLNLGAALRLGEGELRSGGHRRPSILADAMEAVFGAIYLDAGFEAAKQVIDRLYAHSYANLDPQSALKDPKTALQEHLQAKRHPLPSYSVGKVSGEAHAQEFEVECAIPVLGIYTRGSGPTRRSAEQAAARAALALIAQG